MFERLAGKHLTRVSFAFDQAEKFENIDDLIGFICWYAHFRWLRGKSLGRLLRDIGDMRNVCKCQAISLHENPLQALLIPISDPILVPWPVHHEHYLRDGSGEDAAAVAERQNLASSVLTGLLFAAYLKHVGRFADARVIYKRMVRTGFRFEGYFGLADIEHLFANWVAEMEPYRKGAYYLPGSPVSSTDFRLPEAVDCRRIAQAISWYEQALMERPDSIIGRRSLGRALIDAGLLDQGVDKLIEIESKSLFARLTRIYTIAVSPKYGSIDILGDQLENLPCFPDAAAKMRCFEIASTREAATLLKVSAALIDEAKILTGTYIADVHSPKVVKMHLQFPEIWASTFGNVRSLGHGILIADDQVLIADGKGLPGRNRKLFSPDLYAISDDRGVVGLWPAQHAITDDAVLLIGAVFNYYHWILETLPALMMLLANRADNKLSIYLESSPKSFQIDSLRLAIPENVNITVLEQNVRHYWFSRVHHVQNSSVFMVPRPTSVLMMREALSRHLSSPAPGKRIYLSRDSAGSRRNQNEKSLTRLLAEYCVETIDTGCMKVEEQIEFFKDVELVVAPAGAALTNLIFCPSSTRVVIMTSGPHHFETFTAIAAAIGQPCWVSMGSGPIRPNPYFVWTTFDLEVNLSSLRRCLESATNSLPRQICDPTM